jgi:SAM-dependent methyltransferase
MDARDSESGRHSGATDGSAPGAKSPLSAAPPKKIRDLPRSFLLEQLELYYGKKPPETIVERDYSLWRCAETGFEFAWPMLPGNIPFYEWVSGFASYYPGLRWEYGEVQRLIEPPANRPPMVLDVGCGKGDFLQGIHFLPASSRYALDLNEPAIRACRQLGFQAYCGTIAAALAAGFVAKGQFPVVTSFHCLEHVDDPVEFVRSLAAITAPGGRLFLSTPYSPMSFESDWFDILNHPPHHMTRWNLAAYQRLASLLGLRLRYFVPASNTLRRALSVFRLLQYGPNRSVGKARFAADLLRHFPKLAAQYRKQKERGRDHGGIAADVILVELTLP